jgi:hypothetical protein
MKKHHSQAAKRATPFNGVYYDTLTLDYGYTFEGRIIGFAPTRKEAEERRAAEAHRILSHRKAA